MRRKRVKFFLFSFLLLQPFVWHDTCSSHRSTSIQLHDSQVGKVILVCDQLADKLVILYDLVKVTGEAERSPSAGIILSFNSLMRHTLGDLCRLSKLPALLNIVQGHLSKDKAPGLEDFLEARDYVGAAAFLRFQQKNGSSEDQAVEWLAYVHYHNWEHAQVLPANRPTCTHL